jgi:uncharacterized protein with NRDE domain
MCILFVAVQQHKDYPLIIAANRDEFFARPTQASSFWHDSPLLLAGKDLQAGGSWMGINRSGRLAALTNIRDPLRINDEARTRGELVSQFLQNTQCPEEYTKDLKSTASHYNGYNLLFGNWDQLQVYNNHLDKLEALSRGVYGLSNASLNSPWPKISKGTMRLEEYCHDGHPIEVEHLFNLLKDPILADDALLPKTGVPIEWERRLSSIFIEGEQYGTRSSTVLLVDKNRHATWHERTFDNKADCNNQETFHFHIN